MDDLSFPTLTSLVLAAAWLVGCEDGVGEPIRLDGSALSANQDSSANATELEPVDDGTAVSTAGAASVDTTASDDSNDSDDATTQPADTDGADATETDGDAGGTAEPDAMADEQPPGPDADHEPDDNQRDFTDLPPNGDNGFFGGPDGSPPSMSDPDAVTHGDVPSDEEACVSVDTWLVIDTVREEGMVNAINTGRSLGTPCSAPSPEGMAPLSVTPRLRCSARLHARDMVERDFFGEINPDGETPDDRIAQVGFSFSASAEVISRGSGPAYDIFPQLISDPATCQELMDPALTNVGVGFYAGRWTIDLARP